MGLFSKKAAATHRDPVCGMDVSESAAAGKLESGGKTFFFCSSSCMEKFRKDSKRYGG